MDRKEIAYHEAGHCVAALLLLELPRKVSIVPGSGHEGFANLGHNHHPQLHPYGTTPDDVATNAFNSVFVLQSGLAAQMIFIGQDVGDPYDRGAGNDTEHAEEIIARCFPDADCALEWWDLYGKTETVFRRPKVTEAVTLLAEALLEHDIIESDSNGIETMGAVSDLLAPYRSSLFAEVWAKVCRELPISRGVWVVDYGER